MKQEYWNLLTREEKKEYKKTFNMKKALFPTLFGIKVLNLCVKIWFAAIILMAVTGILIKDYLTLEEFKLYLESYSVLLVSPLELLLYGYTFMLCMALLTIIIYMFKYSSWIKSKGFKQKLEVRRK